MPLLIQTCQGKTLNASLTNAIATFASNNTAGNLLAVAYLWFPLTVAGPGSTNPAVSISDSRVNPYSTALIKTYTGGVTLGVAYCLSCAAGANTVTAQSSFAGVLMVCVHEVRADTGQTWKVDTAGFGSAASLDHITTTGSGNRYSNDYAFACFGIDNRNFLPNLTAPAGFTNRLFNSNNTSINTGSTTTGGAPLLFYGSLCTWDNVGANAVNIGVNFQFPDQNVYTSEAIVITFGSVQPQVDAPSATPPAGTYVGTQSITLFQSQSKPMYFTLDGSTPTISSTLYSGPISITANSQLNVLAHDPSSVLADIQVTYSYVINPPPPPGATITLSWQRRTRLGGAWQNGTENPGTYNGPQTGALVPLNEDSESYDVEIINDVTGLPIRTFAGLTSPTVVYTPAMQFSDFSIYVTKLHVKIYQNSAQVGRGFVANIPNVLAGHGTLAGSSGVKSLNAIAGTPSADNQVLTYVAENADLEWLLPSQGRTTLTKITRSLASGAVELGTLNLFKTFLLLKVTANKPCRLQLYSTAAARAADSDRPIGILPAGARGVICDISLTSDLSEVWGVSALTVGSDLENTPSGNIAYRITNDDVSAGAITVNITVVPIERR